MIVAGAEVALQKSKTEQVLQQVERLQSQLQEAQSTQADASECLKSCKAQLRQRTR